jgi:putative component of toxin-antitoxin plasmid stabilization module
MNRDVVELEDGIWELRVVGRGSAFRCLCFLDARARDRVVVLTACVAKASIKKRHVMTTEVQRAKVRRGLYLEQERRR